MAGVKITQLRAQMATGRRYGSFIGKATVVVGEPLLNIVTVTSHVSPEVMRVVSVVTDQGVRLTVHA